MQEAERIRAAAAALLDKAADASSIEQAAQLLKLAAEIENESAQAARNAVEERKLKDDLSESRPHRKLENRIKLLSVLTPLITTLALIGTLVLQIFQFREQRQQAANTAEDARWSEAMKLLSGRLSPGGAMLATFRQSPRYGDRASEMAQQLLTRSTTLGEFTAVLGEFFQPVTWHNLNSVLDCDRLIFADHLRLDRKAYVDVPGKGWVYQGLNPLPQAEKDAYDQINDEIQLLTSKIGPLLKGKRASSTPPLDLHGTQFCRCDWTGANLSGADLTGSLIADMDLDGADLSGITDFQGSNFQRTAWWNAATISQRLLDYLLEMCSYKPDEIYGSASRRILKADYDTALDRLKKASSIK